MANRKEFSSIRMILTLVLVCGGAAMALAFVSELTREPIRLARLNAKIDAIKMVLPEFENNPYEERLLVDHKGEAREVYPARDANGQLIGVAIPASDPGGYGGVVELLFGFDATGRVTGVEKLKMEETPGLGDGILKPKFIEQFINQTADSKTWRVKKDNGDIDAVTAATISSRAATSAMANAFDIYNAAIEQAGLQLEEAKPQTMVLPLDEAVDYVFPDTANQPLEEAIALDHPAFGQVLYPARDAGGKLTGVAVTGYKAKGYKGPLLFLVGFTPQGRVSRIVTLEEKETPGLGASVATPKFLDQFIDQDLDSATWTVKKNGGSFDAVTGATVSSVAAMDAIRTAFEGYRQAMERKLVPDIQ